MIIFVYITTNLINNKKYIGEHSSNKKDNYLGSGKILKQAIKKYGRKNFKRHILEQFENKEEAFNAQEKYIKEYNTLSPNGYNISPKGGLGVIDCFSNDTKQKIQKSLTGRKLSEDHKKSISQGNLGKIVSDETRCKIGEKNKISLKGLIVSEETKIKISNSLKGKNILPKSDMMKEKNRQAHLGKKDSEITKQRKSEAQKNRWKNDKK